MSRSTTLARRSTRLLYCLATASLCTVPVLAQEPRTPAESEKARPQVEHAGEAAHDVADATSALERVNAVQPIPKTVLAKAVAVGVFDNLVRAAFIVGGSGGDGVITRHTTGSWTAPAFFRLGGASIGAQIGATKTDLVLVFMTQKALDALLDNHLEIGAELTAVAGPTAATGTVDTTKDILVYTRQAGLFAGAALNGAVITSNDKQNTAVYNATAREILSATGESKPMAGMDRFLAALNRVGPS